LPSFDIVSKADMMEINNALSNIRREIAQRFDFKDSICSIDFKDEIITLLADDTMKLKQLHELIKIHLTRRKIDLKALDFKSIERATGNNIRQIVIIKHGINKEISKTLVKEIKNSKIKVQVAINGDELRVHGKQRDHLQEVIKLTMGISVDLPLQYVNFRD
jgi:uncharacterized protein YajQ (UPF0234 family)